MPRNNTARKQPQQDWLAASLAEKMPAELETNVLGQCNQDTEESGEHS